MTPFSFKKVSNIEKELQATIDSYRAAQARDRQRLDDLNRIFLQALKKKTGLHAVIKVGDCHEEDFTIIFINGENRLTIEISEHISRFHLAIDKYTNIQMAMDVIQDLQENLEELNELMVDEVLKLKFEADDLEESFLQAEDRLELIQKRRKATLKWFIRPVLIHEEDIDAFLNSVSDITLNDIMDDLMIAEPYRDDPVKVIKETLTM